MRIHTVDELLNSPIDSRALAISDADGSLMSRIANFTSLESLNLSGSRRLLDDDLKQIYHLGHLAELSLGGCDEIGDTGLEHVAHVKTLRTLDISFCSKVTDVGISYLKELKQLRSLTADACYNLGDSALSCIAMFNSLIFLSILGWENATDRGFSQLAKLPLLQDLRVSDCQMGDDAFIALSKYSQLESFGFAMLNVTDRGVLALAGLKSLRKAQIGYNPAVSKDALSTLAMLMPHCDIVVGRWA